MTMGKKNKNKKFKPLEEDSDSISASSIHDDASAADVCFTSNICLPMFASTAVFISATDTTSQISTTEPTRTRARKPAYRSSRKW